MYPQKQPTFEPILLPFPLTSHPFNFPSLSLLLTLPGDVVIMAFPTLPTPSLTFSLTSLLLPCP